MAPPDEPFRIPLEMAMAYTIDYRDINPMHRIIFRDGECDWYCGYCSSLNNIKVYSCHHCGAPKKRQTNER